MSPSIAPKLLREYVGVAIGTPTYNKLHRAVAKTLADYPRAKSLFDGRETVQLKQLRKLRNAVQAVVKADAELDDGARFALEGLRIADNDLGGFRVIDDEEDHSPPDVRAFAAKMEIALNDAVTELEWATTIDGRGKKRRRTEAGRDWLLFKLALVFRQHYQLGVDDYRDNLTDFLRGLLQANNIPFPGGDPERDDNIERRRADTALFDLLPDSLHQPPTPRRI